MSRLPIKSVHLNKSPMVVRKLQTLTPQMAAKWGVDMAAALRHAEKDAGLPDMSALWPEVFQRPKEAALDVDEDLYGGFVGQNDRRTLQRLRALSPEKLADKRVAFEDSRLEELLFRYRAHNFPDTLRDDERTRWREHCSARLHDGVGGGLSLAAFFERIDALSEGADERGQEILGALYDYAEGIAPEVIA